jgi:D-amino peptidase
VPEKQTKNAQKLKRVFILTDIEGVAGVVQFELETFPTGRYYDRSQKLLTAEVNAAIEGLLEEGVEDILVADAHGPGAIWFEDLHSKAKLIHGRPITLHQLLGPVKDYQASMIIGQHAMAGVATSNMNHTQSSATIDYIKLNGKMIGEIAQFALYQGAYGVPMIFLSGEEDACLEAQALIPGITTAAVKKGVGRGSAISMSAVNARALIKQGVKDAVKRHARTPVKPLVWAGPYVVEKRFFSTCTADAAAAQMGVTRVDGQTVRLQGERIEEVVYR